MSRVNTKQPEAIFRKLKEELQFAGFAVVESVDASGYPKLSLNVDEASLSIAQYDAVSKDIFGGDLNAAGPHYVTFASRNDGMSTLKVSQIMNEVAKKGFAKLLIKTHATVLATAEAVTTPDIIIFDKQWPAHGM